MKVNTFLRKVKGLIDASVASQVIKKLKERYGGDALATALRSAYQYISNFWSQSNGREAELSNILKAAGFFLALLSELKDHCIGGRVKPVSFHV